MPAFVPGDPQLVRYHETRDSAVLWPDIPEASLRAAVAEIARVTAAVLARTERAEDPVRLSPPVGGSTRAFGVAAFASGMGPLLGYWIERGHIVAQDPVAPLLVTHLDHGRRRAVRLRHELDRLVAALGDQGVEVLVLKGSDTAYRYFPDPGTRPMADIDLLVQPERAEQARRTLRGLGFVEGSAESLPHRSDWIPAGSQAPVQSLELTHAENPWAVDVHTTLDRAFFPGVIARFGAVDYAAQDSWRDFARPVRMLRQPLLLAYLACHASHHFTALQLVRLVELVLVARRDMAGRPAAWSAFSSLVARTRTERFVFPALELAERLAPGTVDPDVRRRLVGATPARLRRIVAATSPASVQLFKPTLLRAHMWAATPWEYMAYLAHLLWPRTVRGPVSWQQVLAAQRRRWRGVVAYGRRWLRG